MQPVLDSTGLHPLASVHRPAYQLLLRQLRQARLSCGLTQSDVAYILSRTQSYVSKCESGERRIDPIELAEFAAAYGIRIEKLISLPAVQLAEIMSKAGKLQPRA